MGKYFKSSSGAWKVACTMHNVMVFALITEELYWHSYRLVVTKGGVPNEIAEEEEFLLLPMEVSSEILDSNELEKAHKLVYSHLGKEYDPDMALIYVVPNDRYSDIEPYPTVI